MTIPLVRRAVVLTVLLATALLTTALPGGGLPVAAGQQFQHGDLLTAGGVGPYRIGHSSLTDLTARGLVTDVQPLATCNGFYSAQATGRYTDRLSLRFQGDRLVLISTTDPTIRTAVGGRVGLTLDELENRYGPRGEIVNGKWWLRAYLVPVGGRVVAFFEDPYGPTVYRVAVGERARVLASFTGGDDQC